MSTNSENCFTTLQLYVNIEYDAASEEHFGLNGFSSATKQKNTYRERSVPFLPQSPKMHTGRRSHTNKN